MSNSIGLRLQGVRSETRTLFSREMSATWVSLLFLLIGSISESALQWSSGLFLIIGFVFPGMTHGSLDFYVLNRCNGRFSSRTTNLIAYIACIAMVMGLWLVIPKMVFGLFLLNSAYHFGETDLRHASLQHRGLMLFYGTALLSFLFLTHPAETTEYLSAFGVTIPESVPWLTPLLCFITFTSVGVVLMTTNSNLRTLDVIFVLGIGTKLPLLLAFGIYYIMIHSRSAWDNLGEEMRLTRDSMLRLAAPFTLAGCLFMGAAYFCFRSYPGFFSEPIALVIAGLAAITLPHTVSMSIFHHHFSRSGSIQQD